VASVQTLATGGWAATGPVLATEGILTADLACTGVHDLCGQCDGANTICLGCDLVPNSGKVVDLCGQCGGVNLCVGCDGVVNSGELCQKYLAAVDLHRNIYLYVCIYVHLYTFTYIYTYLCAHIYMYMYILASTRCSVFVQDVLVPRIQNIYTTYSIYILYTVYRGTRMCAYIYIYIYIYTVRATQKKKTGIHFSKNFLF